MPSQPSTAFYEIAPDWACEVLSPSTLRVDRVLKLPIYAREGVPHVWLVDPIAQTLEVFALDGAGYRLLSTHGGDARVRAEPFAEVELELGAVFGLPEAVGG
jgi:Uma2 family endonuclease